VTAPDVHLSERTSVVKQFEAVSSWSLAVAALCLTAGLAGPSRAEETTHGTGKPAADARAFRVAPDSGVMVVKGAPAGQTSDAMAPGRSAGRSALDQPQCTVCLMGNASATWTGATGSFHIDRVVNYRSSGTSGQLDLKMVLTATQPVWGQTIYSNAFSNTVLLNPLSAGYQYTGVDSGTISYYGSSIPVGQYFLLTLLRENVGGTFGYVDWIQMDGKLSCDGFNCSVIAPPSSCVEDAYTMCLVGGRYRATGRWKNQYAGGAQANLAKAKLTDVTGAFWIADANTYEFMIRVNTATNNGRAWISILTFTDVEFWVAVTDVTTGQTKEYHSDPGNRTLIYDPSTFVYP
jgi:hypothetical protein